MVAEWRQRAMSAVRAGDDVVAKEALVQTREHEHAAANLRATHDGHVQELERAKADLAEQSRSLEDAKQKKSALLVRAKRLNQSEWLTALVGAGAGRPAEVLERAAAMLDTLEREARIERELGDPVLVPKKPLAKTSSDREERAEARPARRTKR
jgi:phage shock protein A